MIDSELQGSWDQPTRTIVMQNMDATRMQQLAMQFTDKAMVGGGKGWAGHGGREGLGQHGRLQRTEGACDVVAGGVGGQDGNHDGTSMAIRYWTRNMR